MADLFKLQDQVVARLANTLGFELVKAEAEKSARSRSPDVVDLDMRGWVMIQQWLGITKDYVSAARAWFEQALKIDPNDPDALAGSAYTHFMDYGLGWRNPEIDYEAKVHGQADRAIALAHDNLWAYYVNANYLAMTKRANEAVAAADAGLAINPNFARLYVARASAELYLGRNEQAISEVKQAMRLSPHDPEVGWWHGVLGIAEFNLQHYQEAVDQAIAPSKGVTTTICLRASRRCRCARRQDGRREGCLGRGPPRQSATHRQMAAIHWVEYSDPRRPA